MDQLFADFTTTITLVFDLRRDQDKDETCITLQELCRRVQLQLADDMSNAWFSGLEVGREKTRRERQAWVERGSEGTPPQPYYVPLVFTSQLGHGTDVGGTIEQLGEMVTGLSTTPQVLLDCGFSGSEGGVEITWDYVREAFPETMAYEMMGAVTGLLDGIGEGRFWDVAADAAPPLPEWLRGGGQAATIERKDFHTIFDTPSVWDTSDPRELSDYASMAVVDGQSKPLLAVQTRGHAQAQQFAVETRSADMRRRLWSRMTMCEIMATGLAQFGFDAAVVCARQP
jgi:hypothetical protein